MMQFKKRISLVHVFYLLFFLFMMNRLFFSSYGIAERTMSYVVYPFFKIKSAVVYPFEKAVRYIQNVDDLQNQVDSLTKDREDLQAQLIRQKELQTFHEQSKSIVEFARRYEYQNKQVASILLTTISEQEDAIFIDVGKNKYIVKDDVVIYKNMLVGRIIEVYPWYSKVALLTDQRCRVSAKSGKNAVGVCCGKNNGRLELNFVPHFKDVQIGDILTSTGKGLVYPKGFCLGTVKSIQSDNVSHYIQVQPMFDIDNIEFVYILSKE